MKPISGMKLNRGKGNAFASQVAVYQPSLFAEDNVSAQPPPALPATNPDAQAIQELNALVLAQYEMSPLERRIFIKVVERLPDDLRQVEGIDFLEPIRVAERDILEGMEVKAEEQPAALEKAGQALIRHICWISAESGPIQVGLFSSVQHLREQGVLRIGIDALVHPYLRRIKAFFDLQQLETLIEFKSFYSKCLHELFRKAIVPSQGLYYPLPHLKRLLLIEPQEYERYNDLKRFVLQRSQKELAASAWAFSFLEKRTANGKVLGVVFTFPKLKTDTR